MPSSSLRELSTFETVDFSSSGFRLEGELGYPGCERPRGAVVIAGPHPLLGGDMENNVVRSLAAGLTERAHTTLRFNYRGVGDSQVPSIDVAANLAQFWQTSHVPDELDRSQDLDAACQFMRTAMGWESPMAVVGYSFGCALLPVARGAADSFAWVLIAPTLRTHNYSMHLQAKTPMLVVASNDDFAGDGEQLELLIQNASPRSRLIRRRLDNHFFRGHEAWLVSEVAEFLDETMEQKGAAA